MLVTGYSGNKLMLPTGYRVGGVGNINLLFINKGARPVGGGG